MSTPATDVADTPEATTADEANLRQFVTFFIGGECFAFPMGSVREIIRAPHIVAVPMTPQSVTGLANLRGVVLPIMDMRVCLSMGAAHVDDATRAIVVDCGRPVGLIVDRVARVVSFEADRIESGEAGGARENIVVGVVNDADGEGLIQILDPAAIVARESVAAGDAPAAAGGGGGGMAGAVDDAVADADDDTVQLVSVSVEGQEYAFPIAAVDEIVRPPESVARIPDARPETLGLINLRNRMLPIVSLRRMFQLDDAAVCEANRIVVVRLAEGGGPDARVGVVVDSVREVLRVDAGAQVRTPALAQSAAGERLAGMLRLDGRERLVGVLSVEAVFDAPAVREALAAAMMERGAGAAKTEIAMAADADGETQLVVYQLAEQEYGVPIAAVQEIIRVPETLTSVPLSPGHVAGVINLRGVVLPVVSMRARFGLEDHRDNDRQRILVLTRDGARIGFIVDSVTEVLRLPVSAIEGGPRLSEAQRRLIGCVANLNDGARIIQILDAEALLDAAQDGEAAAA